MDINTCTHERSAGCIRWPELFLDTEKKRETYLGRNLSWQRKPSSYVVNPSSRHIYWNDGAESANTPAVMFSLILSRIPLRIMVRNAQTAQPDQTYFYRKQKFIAKILKLKLNHKLINEKKK